MDILLFTTRLCIIACRHLVPYYYTGEYIKASDIAKLYSFKIRSLSPSFTALTKAGILNSRVGGSSRGFILARDSKLITLYDILQVLEDAGKVECCGSAIKCSPMECSDCSIYTELSKVVDRRKEILSGQTLYDHYQKMIMK